MIKATAITLATTLLWAQVGFAKTITLKPGESINVFDDVVYCSATQENPLPVCTIKRVENGYYGVYVGSNFLESHYSMESAIGSVKKLRDNRLCQ